jgi:hypothetical protein|tara:strand:+ start:205 stop:612 length:408 start_codon:yes stop_codon:yes gene_type:complete
MKPLKADPELAKKRLAICEKCKHFRKRSRSCGTPVVGNKVGNKRTCGCFVDAKTKISFTKCPFSYWNELQVTENDYLAIKKLLEEVKHSINPDQKEELYNMIRKYIGGNTKTSNCVPCLKSALKEMNELVKDYEK